MHSFFLQLKRTRAHCSSSIALCLSVLGALSPTRAEPPPISAASLATLDRNATIFDLSAGPAEINAPWYVRIDTGRDSILLTVKNTSPAPITPEYSADLFNPYGMRLARIEVSFAGDSIPPGDLRSRQIGFKYPNIEGIFKDSTLRLPENWKQLRFVALSKATPASPQPKATPVRMPASRPAIFTENNFGTANIGPTAVDARWSNYGAYLQRLIDTIQVQWENILISGSVYPPAGSTVTVTFVLDSDGKIARIVSVDNKSSEPAAHACVSALTDRAPYGPWTADMIATLGRQQQMTFTFYYQ